MPSILPRTPLALSQRQRYLSRPVALHPQTATLKLRIARPTTGDLGISTEDGDPILASNVDWPESTVIRATIHLQAGTQKHHARMEGGGGVQKIERLFRVPVEAQWAEMSYMPTHGFFGDRKGFPRRLGEQHAVIRAWVEIEVLSGSIDSVVVLDGTVAPSPRVRHHSSVAFDAASSEANTTGTTVSVTHTATGANRAAHITVYSEKGSVIATSHSATYDGNAATAIASWNGTTGTERETGHYALDAILGSGAKTVTGTIVGGTTVRTNAIAVVSMTGVDQTTPVGTSPTAHAASSGTTPTVTVGSITSDGLVVDTLTCFYASGTPTTAGTNQTQRTSDVGVTDFFIGASTQSGADGGVMNATKSSDYEFIYNAVQYKAVAASGTAFDRTFAENLAASTSTLRVSGASRALTQNLGVTTAYARVATANRVTTDTAGLTDAFARTVTFPRGLVDSLAAADAYLRTSTANRAPADTLGLTDAFARLASARRALADTTGVSDAFARLSDANRSLADTAGLADATLRLSAASRAFADTVALLDLMARTSTGNRLLTDTLGLAELVALLKVTQGIFAIQLAELLGLQDTVLRTSTANRALLDTLGLTDTLLRVALALRSMQDVAGLSELYTTHTGRGLYAIATVGLTEVFQRTSVANRLLLELLAPAETFSRQSDAARSLTDLLGLAEIVDLLYIPAVVVTPINPPGPRGVRFGPDAGTRRRTGPGGRTRGTIPGRR